MSRKVKFGSYVRFIIENYENEKVWQKQADVENISYQLRLTAFRVATLYKQGYIDMTLEEIEGVTHEKGVDLTVDAKELKNKIRRQEMSQPEFKVYRDKENPSQIIASGVKLFGEKGISGVASGRNLLQQIAKKYGLVLEKIPTDFPKQYIIHDPERKLDAKSLYFNVKGEIAIADKLSSVKSELYAEKAKENPSQKALDQLRMEQVRLSMCVKNQYNFPKYQKWIQKEFQEGTKEFDNQLEFFNDLVAEAKKLQKAGFVQISDKGVAKFTDVQHRTALSEHADKDIKFLSQVHKDIIENKQSANATQKEEAPAPKETAQASSSFASWNDNDNSNEQKKTQGARNRR